MHRRDTALVAFVLLLAAPAAALGSMTGPTAASASPGDRVAFDLYLFGEGNVSIAADGPADWPVYAAPGTVVLPPQEDERYVKAADGYRRVHPVRIAAAVPADAANGTYTVSAAVHQSSSAAPDGTALAVTQLRTATFMVRVGDPGGDGGNDVSTIDLSGDGSGDSADRAGEQGFPYLLVLFEIAWVVAVAYLLLRRR